MSELEISSARFDQERVDPARASSRYVLCATQRSGSFLLCRQLINAGIGVPQEYFNPLHIDILCRRWQLDRENGQTYLRELYARRTTRNCVWGTKLQWPQYLNNLPTIDAGLLETAHCVFLYRADIPAQAVSLHISIVTGVWGFDGTRTTTNKEGIRLGDIQHVIRCVRTINHENDAWRQFFASRRIAPLTLRYEDLVANQPDSVTRVAELLGLDRRSIRKPPPEDRGARSPSEIRVVSEELLDRCRAVVEKCGTISREV